jgi:predicted O-linked N-acetylglucosamine transferase (SPINDLY family)
MLRKVYGFNQTEYNPNMISSINLFLHQAVEAYQRGNYSGAEVMLKRILEVDQKNFGALCILGLINATQFKYRKAVEYFKKAEIINPNDLLNLKNLGAALIDSGENKEGLKRYKKIVQIAPLDSEAWFKLGITYGQLGESLNALQALEESISLQDNNSDAWYFKGVVLKDLGRESQALLAYEKTIELNTVNSLAWNGKGGILYLKNNLKDALACFDKSISINPNNPLVWYNKGSVLSELKKYKNAIESFNKAILLDENFVKARCDKGSALALQKDYQDAVSCFEETMKLQIDHEYLLGNYIHTKLQIADWKNLTRDIENLINKIDTNEKVITPFFALSVFDRPELHKKIAKQWIKNKFPSKNFIAPIANKHEKIRLGYFSADYREHPVAYLTSELFLLHDREKFEVFAFSLSAAESKDPVRTELKRNFDHFLDLENHSATEIAQLARELEIDIAIDLGGHTQDSKTGIFANRAAPIQVNYLGYPGTMGAEYIDYIVADTTIIPDYSRVHYEEKILYMPNSFMIDNSSRVPSTRNFTRAELGLPENAFVYCCFNNGYKFNLQQLEDWVEILKAVDNSVLWLSENNEFFKINILNNFSKFKIKSDRIIFASRLDAIDDHLARCKIADLFLDTHPYNAHATAIDALKAGVPLITYTGNAFAGRVAASLLKACDMSDLITHSRQEYINLAIKMATDKDYFLKIKTKLNENISSGPLFSTKKFVKYLERAYLIIYERYLFGMTPDHIMIDGSKSS